MPKTIIDPKTDFTSPPSAHPPVPEAAPTPSSRGAGSRDAAKDKDDLQTQRLELKALEEELELLKMKNAKQLLQAEIDKLKSGGLTPGRVKLRDTAHSKRERTDKETIGKGEDAKVLALYRVTEKSYKSLMPGQSANIVEPGTIVRLPMDVLPGPSLEAVVKAEANRPVEYRSIDVTEPEVPLADRRHI